MVGPFCCWDWRVVKEGRTAYRREEAGDREEEKMVYVLLNWCILFNEFCNKDFPF